MTGPKRPDPKELAASEAVAATTTNATAATPTTFASSVHARRSSKESPPRVTDLAPTLPSDQMDSNGQQEGNCDASSNNNHHSRCPHYFEAHTHEPGHGGRAPFPVHPHQLAHQHTYPKISLTSLPVTSCIKEEDEYGEEGGALLEKRRLSAQYTNNSKQLTGYEAGYRRSTGSEDDDDDSALAMFSHAVHGTPLGATIPRTFSTSALRMKGRCSFWDRLYTPR